MLRGVMGAVMVMLRGDSLPEPPEVMESLFFMCLGSVLLPNTWYVPFSENIRRKQFLQ